MKKFFGKMLAMMLCVIMVASMCVPVFAIDKKTTEQYAKQLAAAGIQKAAGMIPVIGESVSNVIGNFLPGLLGIESDHDKVMAKLDEISRAIEGLDLKLDQQQQDLFREFHEQKIEKFNDTANVLKGTIDSMYTRLVEIEDEYIDKSQDEKQVAIATLIESNKIDNMTSTVAQIKNLTDYLCGTQISHTGKDGIFQLVYAANCKDSVLGGEAALKSAAYVNTLSQYMETAYKTLFAIYASKLYVCENSDKIAEEMANGTIPKHDITTYTSYDRGDIVSAIFNDKNSSSLITYYNKIFGEENANSAINRYNGMLEDVWFSYITKTDYTQNPAKIDYIPLNPEIAFYSLDDVGYNESIVGNTKGIPPQFYIAKLTERFKKVDKSMMNATHSVLTKDQIDRLMNHFANNPTFGTDKYDLSFIYVLDDLGFSFDAYNDYVDSLPVDPDSPEMTGTSYREPGMPLPTKAETDGMIKIFPTGTETLVGAYDFSDFKLKEMFPETPFGWIGDYVKGYYLGASVNEQGVNAVSVQMIKVCDGNSKNKSEKMGDFVANPNVMLLYFAEPADATLIGSFFSKMSPATIGLICVGAAAIIAVPTVILVRKKKKAAK